MSYTLRPRTKLSCSTEIVTIPDLFGDTQAVIRNHDRRINIKLLCKDLGFLPQLNQQFGSKTEWISADQLINFASKVDEEWHSRLTQNHTFTGQCTPKTLSENAKRDVKLRRRHIQTEQCIYGAMVGENRFKIGCTDLGVTARMVDIKRKLRFEPIVAFIYKVKNPKATEREIFRSEFLQERKVEYMGIKREVFSLSWKDVKFVKKMVKSIIES